MEQGHDWVEQTITGGESGPSRHTFVRYPYLTIYTGSDSGKRFPLQLRAMSIGRSPDADIVIGDRKISKIHCYIEFDRESITLTDNNSTNGLYVNGHKTQQAVLSNNSHLQIGDTSLKIDYKDPEELAYEDDLIRKATTDPLSAIPNRAFFETRAREELAFARRAMLPIALVMIDIDRFKQVNDTLGHQAGDYVIGQLARLIYAQKRVEDILARYGGEEFVLLMRGTVNRENALSICRRILAIVEEFPFSFNDEKFPVTVSMGLCFERGASIESLEQMVRKADLALYRAKNNGRNRVEQHQSESSDEETVSDPGGPYTPTTLV